MDFLVAKHNIFQNPKNLPLNELYLTIKDVRTPRAHNEALINCPSKRYPALDNIFIDERTFPLYQEYFTFTENVEDNVEQFRYKGLKYIESLDFLLQLNYHQFWCYITKNPSTVRMLKSYLCSFTPAVEIVKMDERCSDVANRIHQKVQIILCRVLTFKHSDCEYMTPEKVLQLLEECLLFSFPIVVNIYVAFGKTCPKLVHDLAKLYFTEERKEKWDRPSEQFLEYTLLVFEMIGGNICGFDSAAIQIPIGVPPKPAHFDPGWYEDVLTFFLESLMALSAMITQCMPMNERAIRLGIPYRLTYFYNEVFPYIYKVMGYKRDSIHNFAEAKSRVYDTVAMARQECVECFSRIIENLIAGLSNSTLHEEKEMYVEEYLKLITAALDDELFIFDFHNTNDISEQFEVISQFFPQLDTMQTKYITDYIEGFPKLKEIIMKRECADRRAAREGSTEAGPSNASASENFFQVDPERTEVVLTENEIDERISIVADTLPDLGDAFILECLHVCDYDPVMAIMMILDEELPPHLVEMPRDSIRIPAETPPSQGKQPVMAYTGKKPSAADAKELLDDKSDRELKDIILKSAIAQDQYDDDFDDREEYSPAVLLDSDSSTSDDDEASGGSAANVAGGNAASGGDAFRPFCEDPAKLREQRENARRTFRGRGGHHRGDVVGRAKGQGQDEQVQQNRSKKNVNKAARGNHNRKRGAQFKASRGMF
ncbi:activating signal cointegrator 1 complex subunit 2 [Atheta coriaria]|uniref:activating signal cointegrator 1 complex subunit 2 n=1 Tax=Dalotia coriaria TaxID=877792 RepID=UPI0031F44580